MLLGYNYSQSYSLREAISCVYVYLVFIISTAAVVISTQILKIGVKYTQFKNNNSGYVAMTTFDCYGNFDDVVYTLSVSFLNGVVDW